MRLNTELVVRDGEHDGGNDERTSGSFEQDVESSD